jgi:hypothetical protein
MRTLACAVAALAILATQGAARAADPLVEQLRCMRDAVYTEARGESQLGQLMVAYVVYVRARGDRSKFCSVVYEQRRKKDGTVVSQFSGPTHHPVAMDDADPKLLQASIIAVHVGLGHFMPEEKKLRCSWGYLNRAEADPARAAWFSRLRFADTVDRHSFYCLSDTIASR